MTSTPHPSSHAGYADAFVAEVLADALDSGSRCYAIAGLQGTGKSTLSAQMAALASERGLHVIALSIDDFYLGHATRLALGREVHPLCATRGAPGTHDVALACDVLDALRAGRPVALPRFDKIADDRLPRETWPVVAQADLVILEGWFLEVPPQAPAELVEPLNALERDEDPQGTWRTWSNDALARDYPPLWPRLDRLLLLQGPGVRRRAAVALATGTDAAGRASGPACDDTTAGRALRAVLRTRQPAGASHMAGDRGPHDPA